MCIEIFQAAPWPKTQLSKINPKMLFLSHTSTLVLKHRPSFPPFPLNSPQWGFWISRVCLWVYILPFCTRTIKNNLQMAIWRYISWNESIFVTGLQFSSAHELFDRCVSAVDPFSYRINQFWDPDGIGASISLPSMPTIPLKTAIKSLTPCSDYIRAFLLWRLFGHVLGASSFQYR